MLRICKICLRKKPKYSQLKVPPIRKVSEILSEDSCPKETQTRVHTDLFYAVCKLYGIDHTQQYIDLKTRNYLEDFSHKTWVTAPDERKLEIMDKTQMTAAKITQYLYRRDVNPSRKGSSVLSTGPMRAFDERLEQIILEEEEEKRKMT